MPINWPPPTAPSWPPSEISSTWFSCSNWKVFIAIMQEHGFTAVSPTAAERNTFFKDAECDHGHGVLGAMFVSPGGTRYPFARCVDATHKDFLVLWPPYYAGAGSGAD